MPQEQLYNINYGNWNAPLTGATSGTTTGTSTGTNTGTSGWNAPLPGVTPPANTGTKSGTQNYGNRLSSQNNLNVLGNLNRRPSSFGQEQAAANLVAGLGAHYSGLSGQVSNLLGSGGSAAGTALSNALPVIGSTLPGLLNGNLAQAGFGGAGAALGTAILPGIGTVLGSTLGQYIGGLMGNSGLPTTSWRAYTDPGTGQMSLIAPGQNENASAKDINALKPVAQGYSGVLNAFADKLGLKYRPEATSGFGYRAGKGYWSDATGGKQFYGDPNQVAQVAIYNMLQNPDKYFANMDPALKNQITSGDYKDLPSILKAIDYENYTPASTMSQSDYWNNYGKSYYDQNIGNYVKYANDSLNYLRNHINPNFLTSRGSGDRGYSANQRAQNMLRALPGAETVYTNPYETVAPTGAIGFNPNTSFYPNSDTSPAYRYGSDNGTAFRFDRGSDPNTTYFNTFYSTAPTSSRGLTASNSTWDARREDDWNTANYAARNPVWAARQGRPTNDRKNGGRISFAHGGAVMNNGTQGNWNMASRQPNMSQPAQSFGRLAQTPMAFKFADGGSADMRKIQEYAANETRDNLANPSGGSPYELGPWLGPPPPPPPAQMAPPQQPPQGMPPQGMPPQEMMQQPPEGMMPQQQQPQPFADGGLVGNNFNTNTGMPDMQTGNGNPGGMYGPPPGAGGMPMGGNFGNGMAGFQNMMASQGPMPQGYQNFINQRDASRGGMGGMVGLPYFPGKPPGNVGTLPIGPPPGAGGMPIGGGFGGLPPGGGYLGPPANSGGVVGLPYFPGKPPGDVTTMPPGLGMIGGGMDGRSGMKPRQPSVMPGRGPGMHSGPMDRRGRRYASGGPVGGHGDPSPTSGGLAQIGAMLASQGRNGDSMLAHITPQEAQVLKSLGGSGSINPTTGLPEFFSLDTFLDYLGPSAGSYLGSALTGGNPIGAGLGAGLGSYATGSDIKNSLLAAALGYGGGKLAQTEMLGGSGMTGIGEDVSGFANNIGSNISDLFAGNAPGTKLSNPTNFGKEGPPAPAPTWSDALLGRAPLTTGALMAAASAIAGNKKPSATESSNTGPTKQQRDAAAENERLQQELLDAIRNPISLQRTPIPDDYFSYGSRPERLYFADNALPDVTARARGGNIDMGREPARRGKMPGRYIRGPGDGQSDSIPAVLSNGEYVMDADVVSALGDGSNEAGAAKLDRMRMNLRKHKRSAPASKIPPKAKDPEKYLQGGRS